MEKPSSCAGCPLEFQGNGFTGPEGTGLNGVLVLAEAPGTHEISAGLPLRPNSPAGMVFQGLIRRIPGLERQHMTLSEVIRCQPPRNWLQGAPWEYSALNRCAEVHGKKLVQAKRPRAILALGAIPLRTITGMTGYNQGIKLLRGFQLWSNRPEYMLDGEPIPVVATYHPSFLLRASKTRAKKGETVEGGATGGKVEKAEGGMALSGCVQRDIKLAMRIAAKGPLRPREVKAIRGTREVMENLIRDFKLHPEWGNYFDIETPRSIDKSGDESEIDVIHAHVKAIQFGWNSHEAYVFPGFEAEWVKEGTRELLSLPNDKYSWNGKGFDRPVLTGHHGIPFAGRFIDLMDAWHWIQPDLPRGLQFATSFAAPDLTPWKHLAIADEETYCAYDIVSMALNREYIWEEMKKFGLTQAFERHCLLLQREFEAVTFRGIPMDEDRHKEFGKSVGERIMGLEERIKAQVPSEFLKLEPTREKTLENWQELGLEGPDWEESGFVRTPAPAKGRGEDQFTLVELVEEEREEDGEEALVEVPTEVTYVRKVVRFYDKKLNLIREEPRWHRQVPFSPYSPQQKLDYIKWQRAKEIKGRVAKGQPRADAERLAKYKVPMVTDKKAGKKKENSGSKELAKLAKVTGDPIFQNIVDITKNNKLLGTYGPGSKWKAKKDGCVHPTFGLSDTGTGQMAMWDPNSANAPKHGDIAHFFRKCVRAKPGKLLLEFDAKSFHAQTLALEAKDHAYARMSALDIHSFVTCHRLKLPEAHELMSWSDGDIKAFFSKMKTSETLYKAEAGVSHPHGMTFQEVRDFKAKRVILGLGFAQGANSIFEQNPEGYKDKKEVQAFIDLIMEVFPRIRPFQKDITTLAHKENRLVSKWGYIRRFYDVFQWDANKWNPQTGSMGAWGHGDEYEAAVAFLPANDAFGMIREMCLRLAGFRSTQEIEPLRVDEDLLEKYGFCNTVHDSLMFHCRKDLVDDCVKDVLREMRKPCMVLADPEMCPDGFFVDSEVSIGEDWASMVKVSGV